MNRDAAEVSDHQDAGLNRRQIVLSDASERILTRVYSAQELES